MSNPLLPKKQANKTMVERSHWDPDAFHFGLEAEYLLVDAEDYRPLWHQDLSFCDLNNAMETIPIDDLPEMGGNEIELPHTSNSPYVIEGYHLHNAEGQAVNILPKGLEIRTPVCDSLQLCLNTFTTLYQRMEEALKYLNYKAVALSYHPFETEFFGEQEHRRHDFWQWAMQAMLTFGPDINISVPLKFSERLDLEDLHRKINYYAPAMTCFSLGSPFYSGDIWKVRNRVCKSFRTHRRSTCAPAVEMHPQEHFRFEFKPFEMTHRLEDFENYFLLFLTLLLDDRLEGRASDQMRIYDLGAVARLGFDAETISERANALIKSAQETLPQWGFDPKPLSSFEERAYFHYTPADNMLRWYVESNHDLTAVLKKLSILEI